jgi:hypothetical protein
MDQAPWQEIDVHEGIENTLIHPRSQAQECNNVTVNRDFDRTLLDEEWENRQEILNSCEAFSSFLEAGNLGQRFSCQPNAIP